MTQDPQPQHQTREASAIVTGTAAILIGIIWNEAVLGALFTLDGAIERPSWRVAIGLFNLAFILWGALTIARQSPVPEIALRSVMLLAGLSVSTGLLLAADHVVGRLEPSAPKVIRTDYHARRDEQGIWQPVPGRHAATARFEVGGEPIYDVVYTIDRFGRRDTPADQPSRRDRYILFTGGSYTFGHGVNDDETLPYYVGALTTRYRPYNYGKNGGSPSDALMKFELRSIANEVKEEQGLLIYVFRHSHISRVIGSMRTVAWGPTKLYYGLTAEGEVVRKGRFDTDRPLRTYLYRLLNKSHILRAFNVDLPRYADGHARLTAQIIETLATQYERQFPGGEFYVLFWPGDELLSDMIPFLEERRIKYLVYPTLFRNLMRKDKDLVWQIHQRDSHPVPAAYRTLAEALVNDLNLE